MAGVSSTSSRPLRWPGERRGSFKDVGKYIIFGHCFLVLCFTGNVIAAAEPFKRLMRMTGIFADSGDQELYLLNANSIGASFSIISAVLSGVLNDYAGPKASAMLGQLTSAVGCYLIFFSSPNDFIAISIGMAFLGFTYSAVSISHTMSAAMFPSQTTLAVTLLCVANDISLAVPTLLEWLARVFGSVRLIIVGYCILNAFILVLEFVIIPSSGFKAYAPSAGERSPFQQTRSTYNSVETVHTDTSTDLEEDRRAGANHPVQINPDMSSMPVTRQLLSPMYWIFVLFAAFSFFRKNYFSQLVREINLSIAGPGREVDGLLMTRYFGHFLPTAMLAALINGALISKFGVVFGIVLMNTHATVLYLCASIPILPLQYASIAAYNFFSSFIFGLMYAYLATLFGFQTLGTLQGVLKILVGASGLLCSPWKVYASRLLPSIVWSNRIILLLSCACYAIPFYIYSGLPKTPKRSV